MSESRLEADQPDEHDGIVLRASTTKWMWVLIGSVAIAMFGGSLALSQLTGVIAKALGWMLVASFGFCAFVAVRELRAPGSLWISSESIEVHSRGRLTTYALAHCSRFTTWRNPSKGTTIVVFDYSLDGDTDLARMNRQLMGGSRCLIEPYGVPTESLVDLLNQARTAGSDEPEP